MGKKKDILMYALILLAIVLFSAVTISEYYYNENLPAESTYLEFEEYIANDLLDVVYISPTGDEIRFTYRNEETRAMPYDDLREYKHENDEWGRTINPDTDTLKVELLQRGILVIERDFKSPLDICGAIMTLLLSYGLILILLVFLIALARQTGGLSGKVKAISEEDTKNTTFKNVVGHDEVIADLETIKELFQNNDLGKEVGVTIPRGVLFTGSPGTGKTLLARALAGEMKVPFFYANASQFVEMYVGMGAKRVRELFKEARTKSPCIIFIDEIDAVGRSRNERDGNSERMQTVNALLQELDGFTKRDRILVIAATNDAKCLDKALVRAGRFDRQLVIMPPKDWTVREKLLQLYTKDRALADDVDLVALSKTIAGFTGADIEVLCNEAALITVSNKRNAITAEDFQYAIEKRMLNGNRTTVEHEIAEKWLTAYHEAGHALVTYLCKQPILQVSIVRNTSGVGGYVMHGDRDNTLYSKAEIRDKIKISYGGRAAEYVYLDKLDGITTGASSDIKQATTLIEAYICDYGFDEQLGCLVFDKGSELVEKRKSELALELYKESEALISSNKAILTNIATLLFEREVLSGSEITTYLDEQFGASK